LDFSKNDKAAAIINKWVEEQTNEKIKDIIKEDELSINTKLVLVNAVYFKGTWKVPFKKDATRDQPFYITPDLSVDVPMMHITETYSLTESEDLDCQILVMPYKGERLSMLFLLSKRADDFEAMEKRFANCNMMELKQEEPFIVEVSIPQFKIETTHKLNEPIQALGMTDMFDCGLADFSGLSGQAGLSVSSIVQKAFIEVNEEGTEAAAATAVICIRKCFQYNPTFTCNRPFLFAIRDNITGMILFNGRVVNPLDI
jgi:serpin B